MALTFEQLSKCFFQLLDTPVIQNFLKKDECCAIADKYHLVTILQYFMRADFSEDDFTTKNFFTTLYISHEIYEEVESNKRKILRAHFGEDNCYSKHYLREFSDYRFKLLERMEYRVLVDRHICNHLFLVAPHRIWLRNRKKLHTGVIFNEKKRCEVCTCPRQSMFRFKKPISDELDL